MLQENKVNIIAADVLAPCDAKGYVWITNELTSSEDIKM